MVIDWVCVGRIGGGNIWDEGQQVDRSKGFTVLEANESVGKTVVSES